MYGKIFETTFTGSMMGAGADVFAVWAYALANHESHNRDTVGTVELNPPHLAALIGMTPERVEKAIEFLTAPDPYSRSPEEEGRRLVQEGAFSYRIVNYAKYVEIRNREERREYQREWDRVHRKRKVSESDSIRQNPTDPTNRDRDRDRDRKIKSIGGARKDRRPPTDEEFLKSLKSNPAYKGIDVDSELGKMDAWIAANPGRRQKTRRFVVNWLNRAEKPLILQTQPRRQNTCKVCGAASVVTIGRDSFCSAHADKRFEATA